MTRTYKPYAPREAGTIFEALENAVDQLGGAKRTADVIDRTRGWLDDATNPNREEGKRAHVTLAQAAAMSRAGATALAEYLVQECGGRMLPPIPADVPRSMHAALAATVQEGAEATSEMIQRAADGEIDIEDAKASLARIRDVQRAYATVEAMMRQIIESGEPLR